jgi:hypothetical protein
MAQKLSWTPWHQIVTLRDDVRTGALSLTEFAADLHDVMMQRGTRPIYEDPARFFALTYPTYQMRELAKDVVLRLAGKNAKAIRQLEIPYGGGKTHTLITLRHLVHDPDSLPAQLPAVGQFVAHIRVSLPEARVAALNFDKLDVEKGMEVRGPDGGLRWLKHPWSVLAFQIAGAGGLRLLHPEGDDAERESPPAEPLIEELLRRPQTEGRATLVLIDEVLMYARDKVDRFPNWRGLLADFFAHLCDAVAKVDRCAMVVSLLASDPMKNDAFGKELIGQVSEIFNKFKEQTVQPVLREDVAEVLRRRFFEPASVADPEAFRPHVTTAVANIAEIDETTRKDRKNAEDRFLRSYPFHPDLTDLFYERWTQLDGFQRARGILRTFALALRDSEKWDMSPLVGPNVFVSPPGEIAVGEAARELAAVATSAVIEPGGNQWSVILEGELEKARAIQVEEPGLQFREIEQAVSAVFLSSQPPTQKARTPDLLALLGATRPDRIELEKGLRRWTEVSWFLDEAEFVSDASQPGSLPKAWRLGNRPNLKQMHDDACRNRVTEEAVEAKLLADIQQARLTQGANAAGARVHTLPDRPRDIEDDGDFHFAILGPKTVSDSGKPSAEARRFIDERIGPRTCRNAVVLVAPSRDGLDAARMRVREYLGWEEVRRLLKDQPQDQLREALLAKSMEDARKAVPEAIRQAWSIVVAVNEQNDIQAFKITVGGEPLFAAIKADKRSRIQETAISAEAMLPGGPYDLWREDEPSRRVKDLVGAFAENPKLPKMLRQKAILDTIDNGVGSGIFIATLVRPDQSVVGTWWRVPIPESARSEPALEVFLPAKAVLSELHPSVLARGVLPDLWTGESLAVVDAIAYFSGGRTVMVQREGYEEPVQIPACPQGVVEAAICEAVQQGTLWLINGPASFQGEAVPAGVLTATAQLRTPVSAPTIDRLMHDAVPEAWKDGQTTPLAVSLALSGQRGLPIPWSIMRRAIEDAIASRWLELAPGSGPWPCDMLSAAAVTLQQPAAVTAPSGGVYSPRPQGIYQGSAALEPSAFQDFVEVLPDLLKVAAGVPLQFRLSVTLGEGQEVPRGTVDSVNQLLGEVSAELRLAS